MVKRILVIASAMMLLALPALVAAQADIASVCLVTNIGSINDGSFNESTFNGMTRAAEDYGLETTVIESQSQTEHEQNINTCISEGFDVVLTVGFPMTDVTTRLAGENPDTYFIGVDQFIIEGPSNMVGLQFREDQMGFVVGAMAALMTESGVIAGVYGEAIPPVVKFRNGYEAGAAYINPDIEVLGVYIDSFVAPDRGSAAAEQFIGEGADVIMGAGGITGSGAITYAAQNGAFVIGVDSDEYNTTFGGGETPGAENIITSALKRVDNAVYDMITALVEGGAGFPGGSVYIGDASNNGIGIAPPHDAPVPEEVSAEAEVILGMLESGELVTGLSPVTGEPLPNIVETAVAAETFTTLVAAAEAAGLAETLANDGPFTVFAPTDEAFTAALEALEMSAEDLLADTDLLTEVLLYHVVPNALGPAQLLELETVDTLQGETLTVSATDTDVMVNDATVVAANVFAANGNIHVIDAVLLPPME